MGILIRILTHHYLTKAQFSIVNYKSIKIQRISKVWEKLRKIRILQRFKNKMIKLTIQKQHSNFTNIMNRIMELLISKIFQKQGWLSYSDQLLNTGNLCSIMIHISFHIWKEFNNSIRRTVIIRHQSDKSLYGHQHKYWNKWGD